MQSTPSSNEPDTSVAGVHTKGPWRMSSVSFRRDARDWRDIRATGEGGWLIASVLDRDNSADAALIASAPELLEALEAELADLEQDIRWAESSDLDRLIKRRERMETAITRARTGK